MQDEVAGAGVEPSLHEYALEVVHAGRPVVADLGADHEQVVGHRIVDEGEQAVDLVGVLLLGDLGVKLLLGQGFGRWVMGGELGDGDGLALALDLDQVDTARSSSSDGLLGVLGDAEWRAIFGLRVVGPGDAQHFGQGPAAVHAVAGVGVVQPVRQVLQVVVRQVLGIEEPPVAVPVTGTGANERGGQDRQLGGVHVVAVAVDDVAAQHVGLGGVAGVGQGGRLGERHGLEVDVAAAVGFDVAPHGGLLVRPGEPLEDGEAPEGVLGDDGHPAGGVGQYLFEEGHISLSLPSLFPSLARGRWGPGAVSLAAPGLWGHRCRISARSGVGFLRPTMARSSS